MKPRNPAAREVPNARINQVWFALCLVVSVFISIANARSNPTQTDVFVSGQDGYRSYRIPSLIVTRKGSLLAFCEGRKNSAADSGDIDLLLKRSSDSGKTGVSSAR